SPALLVPYLFSSFCTSCSAIFPLSLHDALPIYLGFGVLGEFLGDDFVAELDAFHTDINAAPGDQPLRLLLGLATKGAREQVSTLDRKSTRLNSSHVSISYAVFCLKKKKIRKRNH